MYEIQSVITVKCEGIRCKHALSVPINAATVADPAAVKEAVKFAMSAAGWKIVTVAYLGSISYNLCPKCADRLTKRFAPAAPAPLNDPKAPASNPTTPPAAPKAPVDPKAK